MALYGAIYIGVMAIVSLFDPQLNAWQHALVAVVGFGIAGGFANLYRLQRITQ